MGKALTSEKFLIAISFAIAVSHTLGAFLGWYWDPRLFWFDMALHLAGGMFVAGIVWWIAERWPHGSLLQQHAVKDAIIFMALSGLVGIGWEFFEFFYDHYFVYGGRVTSPLFQIAQVSMADTMADLFLDILGGFVISCVYSFRRIRGTAKPLLSK